ncbi:uncharacterized protein [Drosophila tropicalis]|uniref:uncharacterized protein isoform X1 n=1 Tax=Drosophila tropicalis TaxID=46794 RepID=UPI0035AC1511
MPICKSSAAKTAADISADHVTEAAQVKRTREQAYFNSYDFDAIEVLPYDEDEDDEMEAASSSSNDQAPGRGYPVESSANKFTYLQRLGGFFVRHGSKDNVANGDAAGPGEANGGSSVAGNDNFLLPRAMLKYQNSLTATTTAAATSMPLTTLSGIGMGHEKPNEQLATAATTAVAGGISVGKKLSIASSTHSLDSGLAMPRNVSATTQPAAAAAAAASAAAAVAGNGSHYSTDKSGSSGYYSSNVCSTYSLDEHIYCEPVIDILNAAAEQEKIKSVRQRPQLQLPLKEPATAATSAATTAIADVAQSSSVISQRLDMQDAGCKGAEANPNGNGNDDDEDKANGEEKKTNSILPHYSDKLRILETSIENLDRHLKTFPSLYAQDHIVNFMSTAGGAGGGGVMVKAGNNQDLGEKLKAYNQLPTIMEQQQQQQQQVVDDSLMDIDLDAFLLKPKPKKESLMQTVANSRQGIDNPSFLSDEQLEENNYKCAKYINSCPEDAYRLESEEAEAEEVEKTYVKRYEDQMHFQSTRELLEDVRDKIRLLSHVTPSPSPTPRHSPDIPKELDGMIQTLKQELESYLQRMNQHSELELRQLCSGLGRQQHVVRLQNAFERRRSYAEPQLNAYEAVRDGVLISANGRPLSVREQIMTIRCASDPNFKMKRKSITEIFPAAECYIESEVTTTTMSRSNTPTPISTPQLELEALHPPPGGATMTTTMVTQLQRNLTFHKPILSAENAHLAMSNLGVGHVPNGKEQKAESSAEWHRKKPSIWEMYYGTNRLHQSLLGKQRNGNELVISSAQPTLSYPSSRPESDFTLDLPRAEQLRLKMEKEKKFRQRCRFITTFLSLVFFLLTVMVVSLVLTRGKRMFGSMI